MFRYRSFLFAVRLLMLFQGKMHAQGFGPSMNGGQRISNYQTPDSLKRRDKNEDSITIYFKYYNNNQILKLDTSINDFFVHYPVPYTSFNLGNLGTATKSYFCHSIPHTLSFFYNPRAANADTHKTPSYSTIGWICCNHNC